MGSRGASHLLPDAEILLVDAVRKLSGGRFEFEQTARYAIGFSIA